MNSSSWQFHSKTAIAFLLIGVFLGMMPSINPDYPVSTHQIQRESSGQARCGDGRHHGPPPPPPPGLPPTVLFLLGAALGYLIGKQKSHAPFPPPHYHYEKPPLAK